jgi:hypothetical protein
MVRTTTNVEERSVISGSYLLCSLDPGGSTDPAAIVVMRVDRGERMNRAKVVHLEIKPPVMTPQMHIELVQKTMTKIFRKLGHVVVRYVVDISNNSAIAYLLAQALPRNSLIGVKITASESHSAGLVPMLVGEIAGKAASIPIMNLSRRQLLLDIGAAFQSGQLTLPLTDPEQQKAVQELKRQMSRASLRQTPSGRSIAVVDKGHDDLLMSLAQGWAATRLPAPRDINRERPAPAISPAAWT